MSKSLQFHKQTAPAIMSYMNNKHFPNAKPEQAITIQAVFTPRQGESMTPVGIIGFKWINKNGIVEDITEEQLDSYQVSKAGKEEFIHAIHRLEEEFTKKGIKKWKVHLLTPRNTLTAAIVEFDFS